MPSFCLLNSMELIPIPNCSLLYMHSNDMNSLKRFVFTKTVIATNIVIKTHKLSTGVEGRGVQTILLAKK